MIRQKALAKRDYDSARQHIATVNANLQEGLSGVRVSQAYVREGTNQAEFESVELGGSDRGAAPGAVDPSERGKRLRHGSPPGQRVLVRSLTVVDQLPINMPTQRSAPRLWISAMV